MQEMLLGIWEQSHKTVLFVTHDIDEALFLGDVVYVMSARPGRIKEEIAVDIRRLRSLDVVTAPAFTAPKRRVLGLIREEAMRACRGLAQVTTCGQTWARCSGPSEALEPVSGWSWASPSCSRREKARSASS